MSNCAELKNKLRDGAFDAALGMLYPRSGIERARGRVERAVNSFAKLYGGERTVVLVSAPGRTEVCGNHTDHQRGRVLAAAIDLDILCVASPNKDGIVRIKSENYAPDEVNLNMLTPQEAEAGTSASLIRGVAAWFSERGYTIGGFDAYATSQVLIGSGLSSSAAFEIAVGNMFKTLYGADVTPVELAIAGQYAENKYLVKPSGLMDQMASSLGGMNMIDFEYSEMPKITPVRCNLAANGLSLCIVDTGGSHANLTPEYAAITTEMREIAAYFGKDLLREVSESDFRANLRLLRTLVSDRALLRGMHFFSDDARVPKQAAALESGDIAGFLALVRQSGMSSLACLQNVFVCGDPGHQGLTLALALSESILSERGGAWRVHGGGFAGTIQAFVPEAFVEVYRAEMDGVFGEGACHVLSIRPAGGIHIREE